MNATEKRHAVTKLEPRRDASPTDWGTLVLVGLVILGLCVVGDLFLRLPPALDAVVSSSRAAPHVIAVPDSERPFHEVHAPAPGPQTIDWPTY